MSGFFSIMFQFYGLDWLAMTLGLSGSYLLSNGDRRGFALNGVACICGLSVALLSRQTGFIAYNTILIVLMCRGFHLWNSPKPVKA